jgi:hypothetical protein
MTINGCSATNGPNEIAAADSNGQLSAKLSSYPYLLNSEIGSFRPQETLRVTTASPLPNIGNGKFLAPPITISVDQRHMESK